MSEQAVQVDWSTHQPITVELSQNTLQIEVPPEEILQLEAEVSVVPPDQIALLEEIRSDSQAARDASQQYSIDSRNAANEAADSEIMSRQYRDETQELKDDTDDLYQATYSLHSDTVTHHDRVVELHGDTQALHDSTEQLHQQTTELNDQAGASASASESSRQASESARDASLAAQQEAETAEQGAMASAEAALVSEVAADNSAGASAASALDSAGSAKFSEQSYQNSKASAQDSNNSALESEQSRSAAKTSETNSRQSELNAAESEQGAAASADAALASEHQSDEYQQAAEQSNQSSLAAKNESVAASDAANESEIAADQSRSLAERWASENEDVIVESGRYSSMHWALKAEQYTASLTYGMYFAGGWDLTDGLPPEPESSHVPWYRLSNTNIDSIRPTTIDIEAMAQEANDGDQLIWDPMKEEWFILDTADQVWMVNGQQGEVVLDAEDVGALPISGGILSGDVRLVSSGENGISDANGNRVVASLLTDNVLRIGDPDTHVRTRLYGLYDHSFEVFSKEGNTFHKVYHTGRKPTPEELGVISKDGGVIEGDLTVLGDVLIPTPHIIFTRNLRGQEDDNLHIDAHENKNIYLNWYEGNEVVIGNGDEQESVRVYANGNMRVQGFLDVRNGVLPFYSVPEDPDSSAADYPPGLSIGNLTGAQSFGWPTGNATVVTFKSQETSTTRMFQLQSDINDRLYWRAAHNNPDDPGFWKPPRKIYHEGDKPTPEDIGALSNDGGDIYGYVNVTGLSDRQYRITNPSVDFIGEFAVTTTAVLVRRRNPDGQNRSIGILADGTAVVFDGLWQKIYHEGHKPTSTDVGLGEVVNAEQVRLVGNNRLQDATSFIIDGNATEGDEDNTRGVLRITMSDSESFGAKGTVYFQAGDAQSLSSGSEGAMVFSGYWGASLEEANFQLLSADKLTVRVGSGGTRYPVYHEGYKPSAGDVGAYSYSESDSRYARAHIADNITYTGDYYQFHRTDELGSEEGDESVIVKMVGESSNSSFLQQKIIRQSDGTDWASSRWRTQYGVDSTYGPYIDFDDKKIAFGLLWSSASGTRSHIDDHFVLTTAGAELDGILYADEMQGRLTQKSGYQKLYRYSESAHGSEDFENGFLQSYVTFTSRPGRCTWVFQVRSDELGSSTPQIPVDFSLAGNLVYHEGHKPTPSEIGAEPTLDADQKRKITISTSDPSGGSDGDIWFKVE